MKWMGLNDLREAFLNFFEQRGHTRLPSFSLVPRDDNSLLLINSGMAPMKKFFMGEAVPPSKRVTTCQKCIRNNDIENVGITSRHLTYFEMLGNFSFGDYFKEQAIPWAWEFFTKTLEIPSELLYISVYYEDDEAYKIWTEKIGIPEDHMVRLGKEDNFWEHGSGPCGPCSEIYFDRGRENGCKKTDCAPGCDCDRFVEVGNIVFSQFESDGKGNYTPMENPNIDFGMGLERLACVMQNSENVFLIDTMQKIMKHVEKIAEIKHGADPARDVSIKIITDHIRSITFMVSDGILGSNENRGYVLRKLIRRAARHGRLLGIKRPFLSEVAQTVIAENSFAYPELEEKRETILRIIENEEEMFSRTIDQGLTILYRLMDKLDKMFSGENAFLLYDTYGFPLDLTKEILMEKNITVDEKQFNELMLKQRERAREARKNAGEDAWSGESNAAQGLQETRFLGYSQLDAEARVLAVIKNGQRVDVAKKGEEVTVVLDFTPFYANSGGQVADTGVLENNNFVGAVLNVNKTGSGVYLHNAVISKGQLRPEDIVTAKVDKVRRRSIMRNHTAAHLLQAQLRSVLGEHVEQAGQLVDEEHVRFDFTNFSAMTEDEIKQVEWNVNKVILDAIPVKIEEMPIDRAREKGAMALFGEKYSDIVRVVSIGDISMELCGGTHMENTANLGLFRIVSESSVASGVRRIEGITGESVLQRMERQELVLNEAKKFLKLNSELELPTKVTQILRELHEKNRLLEKTNARLAGDQIEGLFADAPEIDGIKIVTAFFADVQTTPDSLKKMSDKLKDNNAPVVAVLAGINNEKGSFVAASSKTAQALGIKAGMLVKEVAMLTGGNGGGRPDFAMAGARDIDKINAALKEVPKIIRRLRDAQ